LSFSHASVRGYEDSLAYAEQARHSLTSAFLWSGYKPPLTGLLLKMVGGSSFAYTVLQLVLAIACWSFLAAVVACTLRNTRTWLRVAAAAGILGLSLSRAVALWDRAVLSESVAFSLTAFVLGCGLLLASRFTWRRAAGFLLALAAWVAVRDSNATVTAILSMVLIGGVVVRRLDRRALAIAVGGLAIVGLSLWSSSTGTRWFFPTAQVVRVRILATDEGHRWLARRHPPQLEAADAARRAGHVVEAQPGFEAWDRWIRSDGQKTVLLWLVEHPREILAPLLRPGAVISNVGTAYYTPRGYMPVLGRFDPLAWMPGATGPGLLTLVAVTGLALYRPKQRVLLWVALICAVLALPHAWIAWLLNPMEAARHALVAELQYRLALFLALPVVLSAMLDRMAELRAERPEPIYSGTVQVAPLR
jgi:hypothetical protein